MRRIAILALLILSSAFGARAQTPNTISTVAGGGTNPGPAAAKSAPSREMLARIPLFFEVNKGQTDSRVRFLTRSSGYTLFLTPTETVLAENKTLLTENSNSHWGSSSPFTE